MSPRRSTSASRSARNTGYILVGALAAAAAAVITGVMVTAPRPAVQYTPPAGEAASVTVVRPADRPLHVAFAGDSLTYGLSATTEEAGYRPRVVAGLGASGPVRWSSGGEIGNTIETVTDIIEFPETSDLAILALGTNDVVTTPAERIPAIYDALMQKVRDSAPTATVICLGVWSDAAGREAFDAPIKKSCEGGGGTFISLESVYETPGTRGPAGKETFGGISDDFHPNDAGHAAIADLVLSTITVR